MIQISTEAYGDWKIYYDPPPIPSRACDWHYVHQDFDGEGDDRYGHCASRLECISAIDEYEADRDKPKPFVPVEFAIISTPMGFEFGELIRSEQHEVFYRINKQVLGVARKDIVATFTNPTLCKQQMAKAQALERQLRPLWQLAIEHERAIRNAMFEAVYAIARDNRYGVS